MSRRSDGSRAKAGVLAAVMPSRFGMDASPVRWTLAAGVGVSALRAMVQWASPWPLKLIFDTVLGSRPLPQLLSWLPATRVARLDVMAGAMVVIAILLGIFAYATNALLANAGQRMVFDLRCRLFNHLERQSMEFHASNSVGDLLSRLGGDIQAIQGVVANVVPILVENSLTILGIVVIMLFVDWRYTIVILSLLPVMYLTVRHYLTAIKKSQRQARDVEGRATAFAQEVLISLPVVQAFGAEAREGRRYADLADEGLRANKRSVLLQSRFTPLVTATMAVSTAGVVYFGARAVISGSLTPGDLLVFSAYLRGIYTPVRQLAKMAGMLGRGQASADRVKEVLATSAEPPQPLKPRHLGWPKGEIRFEGVTYVYAGASAPSLEAMNLEIRAGSSHALVGATGSGKSTLVKMIPRFLDPQRGRITLDGIDLRELSLTELRSRIALVPQEPSLMGETVWENIAYGLQTRSRLGAIDAAKRAGVHEVLSSLRDGYDTLVGERGSALSGGQRQCVAFARAMARNAAIILLDEPAAGLDAETEAVLLDALGRLAEGRTMVHVTHHITTVANADRITLLSQGRVVEEGSHRELLAAEGAYTSLHQSRGHLSVFVPAEQVS
ncbi:MAG: ABC transporter ATP-binding protein [Actinomycetota bacterium]|nr:ABC transporter ATP-binding protein [Actinomycetota bacterium]